MRERELQRKVFTRQIDLAAAISGGCGSFRGPLSLGFEFWGFGFNGGLKLRVFCLMQGGGVYVFRNTHSPSLANAQSRAEFYPEHYLKPPCRTLNL